MISPELLNEVQQFAYAYMSKKEIAIITEIDIDLFESDENIIKAFNTGKLKRKAEFNSSVIELSKQLSSPAMLIESKLAEQSALNDLL